MPLNKGHSQILESVPHRGTSTHLASKKFFASRRSIKFLLTSRPSFCTKKIFTLPPLLGLSNVARLWERKLIQDSESEDPSALVQGCIPPGIVLTKRGSESTSTAGNCSKLTSLNFNINTSIFIFKSSNALINAVTFSQRGVHLLYNYFSTKVKYFF